MTANCEPIRWRRVFPPASMGVPSDIACLRDRFPTITGTIRSAENVAKKVARKSTPAVRHHESEDLKR
jgi:hypothetical protein